MAIIEQKEMIRLHRSFKPMLIALGAVILIVFAIFSSKDPSPQNKHSQNERASFHEKPIPVNSTEVSPSPPISVLIDIKGAVKNPGIYEMKSDARVADAVEKAGGFLGDAETNMVNLAQKVQDEMVIHIVKKGEEAALPQTANITGNTAGGQEQGEGKVDINSADEAALQTLSGIGPSKAQAIIRHREENGAFSDIAAITEVSGIGQKTFENLQDQIEAR